MRVRTNRLGFVTENAESTFPVKANTSVLFHLNGGMNLSACLRFIYLSVTVRDLLVPATGELKLAGATDMGD
jgi:hypothetical protein